MEMFKEIIRITVMSGFLLFVVAVCLLLIYGIKKICTDLLFVSEVKNKDCDHSDSVVYDDSHPDMPWKCTKCCKRFYS